jgi:hypothetical protein
MSRRRAALTYTNVVATLALFLALTGGTVWAANKITSKQIGKGAVKNKNLAKNAVKAKNLAKNSVSSAKLAKNAVKNAQIADGAVNFAKLAAGTDVIASSSIGPMAAPSEAMASFNPPLTVTPVAGQLTTVHLEARGSLTATGMTPCVVVPFPVVNGNLSVVGELLELIAPGVPIVPGFENGIPAASTEFPVGLTQPGTPQTIGIFMITEGSCTPNSTVQVSAVVTEQK